MDSAKKPYGKLLPRFEMNNSFFSRLGENTMAKKSVKYSKRDGLENSSFAISKVRITTMIDKDLLDWLKREAEEQNSKYQTLLNNVLRQARGSNPDRLSELENRLTKLEKKIS